ncbi:hypothetical protein PVT67_01870 [Gallaecimonas kandeliae]|uniref:hypothetical protein n=1 Tax=Gallaecimonas kandeliae TaxID=3029055 RepID=UPI0026490889|nr:hypothetical protein [Gallaecimonas kandeliae]WKE66020.1 hypothetical protein PVT67_01870 [Gallaecimonas kandeliae]
MSRRLFILLATLFLTALFWGLLLARSPSPAELGGTYMAEARQRFALELAQVQVLWQRDGGTSVQWQGRWLAVNARGWAQPPCYALWQAMGLPLEVEGSQVDASWHQGHCRFSWQGAGFDYWPQTGQVKDFRQGEQK